MNLGCFPFWLLVVSGATEECSAAWLVEALQERDPGAVPAGEVKSLK